MASSSTHLTNLELSLHANWRTASIQLHSLDAHGWGTDLIALFAEILDVGYNTLACHFWPPGKRQPDMVKRELHMWSAVEAEAVRTGEVQRIQSAASAVGMAADALQAAGRAREAVSVREFGEELHELAMGVEKDRSPKSGWDDVGMR